MKSTRKSQQTTTADRLDRRIFLQKSTKAVATISIPYFIPSGILARAGQPGANDRVNIGVIGLGPRSKAVVKTAIGIPDIWDSDKAYTGVSGMRIASVCDCFTPRIGRFVSELGKEYKWSTYEDFRQMIDKENLDGVLIETTTHARAWISILAMQAGMDAYIEKPMSLTIAEGRAMVNAARRYDRVTQVGTQQRSMPINNWASDLVKNGAIGKVHTVLAPNFVGPEKWLPQTAQPMPAGTSGNWWDIWSNQVELRDYHPSIHYGWSRWWDYDSGGVGFGVTGWGTHSYDQVQRGLGTDDIGPVEIWLEEPVRVMKTGRFEEDPGRYKRGSFTAKDMEKVYRQMARGIKGPRAKVRMEYPDGTLLRLELDGDRGPGLGAIFIGDKGKIEINRNKIACNPKDLLDSPDNPGLNKKPETQYHLENWVECIKSRERCTADIEIGQRSSTVCQLVNIVRDLGQIGTRLRWDPQSETFPDSPEANAMLSRPRRKGYELPDIT